MWVAREKQDDKKSNGVLMPLLPYFTILNLEPDTTSGQK